MLEESSHAVVYFAAYFQRTFTWLSSHTFSFQFDLRQLQTDQVDVEDPAQRMKAAANRPEKANGRSCNVQQ